MTHLRRPRLAVAAALVLLATGCSYDGDITSVDLPFRHGTGDDSYTVTVELAQASGLTENGEVKVDDVTVGTIKDLEVDDWHATLTVGLDSDVTLPANASARVGQKSLLGAKYLEISAPAAQQAVGRLDDGDTIPLSATGSYPETEQVLSALAVVLNGSGLQQVRTITDELNQVLDGREPDVRRLLGSFTEFVGAVDRQRNRIVSLIDRLDRTTATLGEDQVLERALDTLPDAVAELDEERADLTRTLSAVARLGALGARVIDESGGDLATNLRQLQPVLARLADSGGDLTDALSVLVSFPFPSNTSFPAMFRGDYGNLFITLDVTPELLARNLLNGFGLGPNDSGSLLGLPPLGAGDEPTSPLDPFLDKVGDALPELPRLSDLLGGLLGPRAVGPAPRRER